MINELIKKEIDRMIKEMWIHEICSEYGKGNLIKEASLQCSMYHHLRNRLSIILKENNLHIYPEFYFKGLRFFADLAIVEMDMKKDTFYLGDRVTDVAAIIELKYAGGTSQTVADYIMTDKVKLKEYKNALPYNCQYYFGVIYETECSSLHWFDRRSTNNWAKGILTELNAGYLEDEMYFEVNSYNNWNFNNKKQKCEIRF